MFEARVIKQFSHLVAFVASAFAIAVGPIAFVPPREPPHATVDRAVDSAAEARLATGLAVVLLVTWV